MHHSATRKSGVPGIKILQHNDLARFHSVYRTVANLLFSLPFSAFLCKLYFMVRASGKTRSVAKESDNNPIAVRVDPATRAALELEADRAGMKLGPYCRTLLERHLAGESLSQLRNEIADVLKNQQEHEEQLLQVSVGVFDALRTLLLNLTDLDEDSELGRKYLDELFRRVVGR